MELRIEKDVPLDAYTTLQVGGRADYLVEVETREELVEALQFAKQTATPPLILGGGSNILISDEGYRGLVIINKILGKKYQEEGGTVTLTCGAGEELDEVVADSVRYGYWGLENLSAIPGTIGATPIQNVGAYGVEVSSLITQVVAVHTETQEEKIFSVSDCGFAYRDSFFKTESGRKWVVVEVVFTLSREANPQLEYGTLQSLRKKGVTLEDVRKKIIEIRAGKFPDWHKAGTAGSFFKNPIISSAQFEEIKRHYPDMPGYEVGEGLVKVSLGWVLDQVCGLRGYCRDGVCLYEHQALVLVNEGKVDATTIETFANHVAKIVEEKTGIQIEREVRSV